MLIHIEEALPSTMHFSVFSEDTLYFYRYIRAHILITDEQFLLLIDIPYRIRHNNSKYVKFSI